MHLPNRRNNETAASSSSCCCVCADCVSTFYGGSERYVFVRHLFDSCHIYFQSILYVSCCYPIFMFYPCYVAFFYWFKIRVIQKRNFLFESESTYESTLGWIRRTDPPPQKPTMRDLPAFGPTHVAGPIIPNTGNKALFLIRGCNVQRRRTKRGVLKTEERGRILFSKKKKKRKEKERRDPSRGGRSSRDGTNTNPRRSLLRLLTAQ